VADSASQFDTSVAATNQTVFAAPNRLLNSLRGIKSTDKKVESLSSVYSDNKKNTSYSNPDMLYQIATIFQAQIFDNYENSSKPAYSGNLPQSIVQRLCLFDLIPKLPPQKGGCDEDIDAAVLFREGPDEKLQSLILSHKCPTVNNMYLFMRHLHDSVGFSPEANIIALIYTIRTTTHYGITMNYSNWRMIWVAFAILAQKVWDENSKPTAVFVGVMPGTTKQQLRDLEYIGLFLLHFNTTVTASLYTQYLQELQSLDPSGGHFDKNPQPLSVASVNTIETRTTREPRGKIRSGTRNKHEIVNLRDVSLRQAVKYNVLSKSKPTAAESKNN